MEWLVHCIVLVIEFSSKLIEWLLPSYSVVSQVFGSIRNQLVKEIGHFKFVRSSFRKWSGWCITSFEWLDFPKNSPIYSSHHILLLPMFWARSEINWSKKLDISSSLDVRSVIGVVGGLHSSSDWISLLTHQWLLPPHYGVAKILGTFRTQLVKEIRDFMLVRSSFHKCSGWGISQF